MTRALKDHRLEQAPNMSSHGLNLGAFAVSSLSHERPQARMQVSEKAGFLCASVVVGGSMVHDAS